jgi:hypothetical protein
VRAALGGPPQRAVGVAADIGLHQSVQRRRQPRLGLGQPLGATTLAAHRPVRVRRPVQLGLAPADRRPGDPGQGGDPDDPAAAQHPGGGAQQQAPLPLGQVWQDQNEQAFQQGIGVHPPEAISDAQNGQN